MFREASIVLAGAVILAYAIEFLFSCWDDSREPPRVSATVPIVGHIVGFWRHGFDYYDVLSRKTSAEIYTIGILNFKVYVTHSTRLTHAVQRSKTLSVVPFLRSAHKTYGSISDDAYGLLDHDLMDDFNKRTKAALAPGLYLDEQNLRIGNQSLIEVGSILERDEIQLFEWSKHVVITATSVGLFGVEHPFKDSEVAEAMWTWDEHRLSYRFGIDPLRRGYNARAKVFEAFRKYFENIPEDASKVIQERQRTLRESGIRKDDIYKIQSTLSNANSNVAPTLFWTIYEIYSRPELLETIRKEILSNAVQKGEDGSILNVTALQTECPLLLSAYQETQRTRHSHVTFRMVVEDTVLDEQYLLKKGSPLHLPGKPIHENPQIWGPQTKVFDPYRFVPAGAGETKTKITPNSFQPWGTAPFICPGRQFASTEILTIVALLALSVKLAPASGEGWDPKPAMKEAAVATLPHPRKDMRLKITTQEGAGNWKVVLGRSKARVSLASG